MKKMLSALLFASLFICLSSSAYAKHSSSHHFESSSSSDDCSCDDDFSCDDSSSSSHERFHGGTFVGPFTGSSSQLLLQYILEPDGTAYFSTSPTTDLSPEVGTWEVKKNHILITTVGTLLQPVPTDSNPDAVEILFVRLTQKIKIRNNNTLDVVHVVARVFNNNEDPTRGKGTVVENLLGKFQVKRVEVRRSDLKVK
jgi:hypothetical protein